MKRVHGTRPIKELASETNHSSITTIVAIDGYSTQSWLLKAIDPLRMLALQGETLNTVDKSKMPDLNQTQIVQYFQVSNMLSWNDEPYNSMILSNFLTILGEFRFKS